MLIQLCIDLVIVLMGVYYVTMFLKFMGVKILPVKDPKFGLAMIPFYYWFVRKNGIQNEELSFEEKLKNAETAVELAKKEVEILTSEANQKSGRAKKDLDEARKVYKKAKENLELLKQTSFK